MKQFHKFLVEERLADEDPTALIESPTLSKHLPMVLTQDEVARILEAPETQTPRGLRDRCQQQQGNCGQQRMAQEQQVYMNGGSHG